MKNMVLTALMLIAPASAFAAGAYDTVSISTATGKQTKKMAGIFSVASTSVNINSPTIKLDGSSGGIDGSSITVIYVVKAGSVAVTGAAGYITCQSSISASAFWGDGSKLTGIVSTAAYQGADTILEGYINSTGSALTSEISRATLRENNIGTATGTIRVDFTAQDVTIGASTKTLTDWVNSTGSALTSEIANRIAQDNTIGGSTNTLRADFTAADVAIGASTKTLTDLVNTKENAGVAASSVTTHNAAVAHANGISGTAANITGNLPGAQIDGSTYTTAIGLRVLKAGDTMTGALSLTGAASYITAPSSVIVNGLLTASRAGIGTTAPSTTLRVVGDISNSGQIVADGSSTIKGDAYFGNPDNVASHTIAINAAFAKDETLLFHNNVGGQGWKIYRPGLSGSYWDLRFSDVTADRLTLEAGGNIGIGTTDPAQLLDVRGNIVGNSSVTASAFFGDGSHLTGIAVTFSSSRTAVNFCPGNGCTASADSGVCVVGSTLTVTTNGSPVMVYLAGIGAVVQNTSWVNAKFLVDGRWPAGLGSGMYLSKVADYGLEGVNYGGNLGFTHFEPGLSAGEHTFCLVIYSPNTDSLLLGPNSYAQPEFGVIQVK